ncbi:uncharacterized protein LOC141952539 [Strix uralensis]|uniref:uncharacterized protein LOC141952539 n=1 Tax=Strix uralensis TaxID=36305 RepID=UPI003DA793DE
MVDKDLLKGGAGQGRPDPDGAAGLGTEPRCLAARPGTRPGRRARSRTGPRRRCRPRDRSPVSRPCRHGEGGGSPPGRLGPSRRRPRLSEPGSAGSGKLVPRPGPPAPPSLGQPVPVPPHAPSVPSVPAASGARQSPTPGVPRCHQTRLTQGHGPSCRGTAVTLLETSQCCSWGTGWALRWAEEGIRADQLAPCDHQQRVVQPSPAD